MALEIITMIGSRLKPLHFSTIAFLFILLAILAVWASPISIYSVLSDSMIPTLRAGDVIVTIPPDQGISVGDIVVYKAGRLLVTHRVVTVEAGGLRTKGDANEAEDPALVPSSAIVGLYQGRIPFAGHLLSFVRTPLGWITLVVLPVVCFSVIELRRAYKLLAARHSSS